MAASDASVDKVAITSSNVVCVKEGDLLSIFPCGVLDVVTPVIQRLDLECHLLEEPTSKHIFDTLRPLAKWWIMVLESLLLHRSHSATEEHAILLVEMTSKRDGGVPVVGVDDATSGAVQLKSCD